MARSNSAQQTLLGFDYGRKRIGVAVGQELTQSATALTTVRAHDGRPDWSAIERLLEEWQPDALVVGIPYHMDGSDQPMTQAARRFSRQLRGRYRLPVYEVDERLSSYIVETGLSGRTTASPDIDPLAAQIILQDWLQQKEPQSE